MRGRERGAAQSQGAEFVQRDVCSEHSRPAAPRRLLDRPLGSDVKPPSHRCVHDVTFAARPAEETT